MNPQGNMKMWKAAVKMANETNDGKPKNVTKMEKETEWNFLKFHGNSK